MPGPPPKRDAERRRQNKPNIPTTTVDLGKTTTKEVEIPSPLEEWHPIARMMYDAFLGSGQVMFYEPTDWALAFVVVEELSRELSEKSIVIKDGPDKEHIEWHEQPMPGSKLTALLKAMTALMVAEGDRRRLRMELERPVADDGATLPKGVTSIMKNRQEALGG